MATFSQYVTDEDIQTAKDNIAEIDNQLGELILAEKTGMDVADLRNSLNETKAKLQTFIQVYEKVDVTRKTRKG